METMMSLGKTFRGWMLSRSRLMRKTWSGKLPGAEEAFISWVSPSTLVFLWSLATVPVTETGLCKGVLLRSWFAECDGVPDS